MDELLELMEKIIQAFGNFGNWLLYERKNKNPKLGMFLFSIACIIVVLFFVGAAFKILLSVFK